MPSPLACAAGCLCAVLSFLGPASPAAEVAVRDAADLGAALQAAPAGTTLVLPAGTFPAIRLPEGVGLRGAGPDRTVIDAGAAPVGIEITGGVGSVVEGLAVRSRGTAIQVAHAADVALRRLKVRGGALGIRMVDVSAARVEDVVVDGSLMGMGLAGLRKSAVVQCTFYRNNSACLGLSDVTDSVVFNNILAEAGVGLLINGRREGLAVDHNLYLALHVGRVGGDLARVSLGTWRAVTGGLDAASVQLPVRFADPDRGDYRPVSTLDWAPWRATTAGWGVPRLAGVEAPPKDLNGRDRGPAPGLGACEPAESGPARPDGEFEVAADEGLKSAGLFRKDGTAIRHLFRALPLKKGRYGFALPTRTTLGGPIAAGDYEVRLAEGQLRWSYRGMTANNGVSNDDLDADFDSTVRVAFAADGALLLGNGWNERLTNLARRDVATRKGRWAFMGTANNQGLAVAADGTILLLREAAAGYTLSRIDPATGAPIEWGPGRPAVTLETGDRGLEGLAELDGTLYFASTAGKLYLTPLADPRLDRPVELAAPRLPVADRAHRVVWLVSGERVVAVGADGKVRYELAAVPAPQGVATDGARLAVASYETGKVHLFDLADPAHPRAVGTVGAGDGPYGTIRADRFWFQRGPYTTPWRVPMDLDAAGRLAVCDRHGRVLVFDAGGRCLYQSFAQFGNAPFRAEFPDNGGRTRFFDNSGSFTWWVDEKAGRWEPDAYWGKPPLNQQGGNPPVHFFGAGGAKFAAMQYRWSESDGKTNHDGVVILRYDDHVGRPVTFYTSGPSGQVAVRDANADGVIDGRDGAGTPVLDDAGRPLARPLVGRWLRGLPDGSLSNGTDQVWKLKGLAADGSPRFEFPAAPAVAFRSPTLPSPYDFARKVNLGGQSESEVAPDGDLLVSLQGVEGSPTGLGLSNSGGIDLARVRPDGSLRWYLPLNDYGPLQGIKAVDRFLLTGWGHQAEWLGLDDYGLALGHLGFPAAAKWGGYWVDHPNQYRMYVGNDGKAHVTIGEYMRNCHHWMTLEGHDNPRRSTAPVTIDEAKARALAARPAVPVAILAKPQAPRITIPRLAGPMPIDGGLAKWRAAGVTPQVVMTPVTASAAIKGPADASAIIRLAYEGHDLYVQVLRFDDAVDFDHTVARGTHLQDTVEMMLNGFFPDGFQFSVSKFADDGDQIVRRRFFFRNNEAYLVPPDHAPRVVKVLDDAGDVEERGLIEGTYGVDLSASKVIVTEFKLPIDRVTWRDSEETLFPVGPGKTVWVGFMIDDNDIPGTDVQDVIVWPASFGTFAPKETGALATFE